ncbi:MAG: ThiF family adenylyltransferase [Candidatus Thiodiazotropha endolucinida]
MTTDAIQKVHKWLNTIGFQEIPGYTDGYAYQGELVCKSIPVPIQLSFPDLNFIELPKIHLLRPRPEELQKPLAHVDQLGELCYLDKESYRADRYDPSKTIATYLAKAKEVLEDSIIEKNTHEVGYELQSYWVTPYRGITLTNDKTIKTAYYNLVEYETPIGTLLKRYVIGSKPEIESFIASHNGKNKYKDHEHAIWIRLNSNALLPVEDKDWPPIHPKAIFHWLKEVDQGAAHRLQWILGTKDGAHNPLLIAFRSQHNSMVGTEIYLPKKMVSSAKQAGQFKKLFMSDTGRFGTKTHRIIIDNLSEKYQITRNLKGANLANRKIVLIGCGTIGGYLARLMVQAGAGQEKGKLTLCDADDFRSGNVGRHYLDSRYLYVNKANACRHKLLSEYTGANIKALGHEYSSLMQDINTDIIIDATGHESFSELLNEESISLHKKNRKCPPLLYSWIDGGGNCVRSLYYDGKGGCYRCLRNAQGEERFKPIRDPSSAPSVKYQCGESYTPYPASVSVHAAGLALDALLDWAQKNPAPRFRNIALSPEAIQHKNQNLTALKHCPACQN